MRRLGLVLSVAVVAWGAVTVPMPFTEIQPGSARPAEDIVELSAATGEVRGDLALLTVTEAQPNIIGAVWVALHPDRDLLPERESAPSGIDPDAMREIQRDAFRSSFLTAVVVAAREVGIDVEQRTRAVVADVMRNAPADGLLAPGDEIVAADGTPVSSSEDLVAELGRSDEERPVDLVVLRDGERRELTVELRQLPSTERPVLGILVETLVDEPDLPFEAELRDTNIVGPSAGLMIALASADLLLEEDLAAGRVVVGTGTIDADGDVGRISGLEQKTRAAIDAGADLLLVPVDQLAEAAAARDAGIRVVGVRTFRDALDALRGTSDDLAAP